MWCGPTDERPYPSLGWDLADILDELWPAQKLIEEQARKLIRWYRLEPDGSRFYRRGQLMGPKGVGKSPEGARIAFLELSGPVTFAGWDAQGEPVGKPWDSPVVQIAAVSEDQADNTYGALLELLTLDDGRVADLFGLDAGQTRVLRKGQPSARIDAVTAASGTREGQRVTFGLFDETHLWTPSTGGHKLAATIRRNAAKMGGTTLETTNAYDPNLRTVAQATDEAVEADSEGVFQWKPQAPHVTSLANRRELRSALKKVYDGAHWIDVDRLIADIHDPDTAEDDARRFFLNEIIKTADSAWSSEDWAALTDASRVVADREPISLGFDGARFHDATALVGCTLADGHLFVVDVWAKPDATDDWSVDALAVDSTVRATLERFDVVRFYADPPYWQDEIARWSADYGAKVVAEWWTNRDKMMAWATRRFTEGVNGQTLTHDGDSRLAEHVSNAKKRPTNVRDGEGRFMWTIRKSHDRSPLKIDAVMAAILALEARADALTAGWKPKRQGRTYTF